jgi:hypothetical protein
MAKRRKGTVYTMAKRKKRTDYSMAKRKMIILLR